ncbi:hypothetical protein [Streptomyces sp. NPDC002054]|uniref:hypothetical protein n=1 Tax=Streptomyces sp. NPDC002054 TaxID=3154663 RepID=UPI003333CF61
MNRLRRSIRAAGAAVLLPAAVAGCGVKPTGVIDAGEPASGLTKGMRLYFASDTGLRGVPRPDLKVKDLNDTFKLLLAGPDEAERQSGLTSLVRSIKSYRATGEAGRIVVEAPEAYLRPEDRLLLGQLVCSLARTYSVLHPEVRPDDVRVTLRPQGEPLGPYHCSPFLAG